MSPSPYVHEHMFPIAGECQACLAGEDAMRAEPSEFCPNAPADDPGHCEHWYDCEPCHRCGDDTIDPNCDCERCTSHRAASAAGIQDTETPR